MLLCVAVCCSVLLCVVLVVLPRTDVMAALLDLAFEPAIVSKVRSRETFVVYCVLVGVHFHQRYLPASVSL